MYPFRVCGRKIEIYKYCVNYKVENEEINVLCTTKEEADLIGKDTNGVITKLDVKDHEWLDNLIVPDLPDTFSEAVKIYNIGKDRYVELQTAQTQAEYLFELEVRLSKLELGINT